MNYLAHVFLARHSNEAMIGGLLGDFVKGSIDAYPAEIHAGILLHRAIDRIPMLTPWCAPAVPW